MRAALPTQLMIDFPKPRPPSETVPREPSTLVVDAFITTGGEKAGIAYVDGYHMGLDAADVIAKSGNGVFKPWRTFRENALYVCGLPATEYSSKETAHPEVVAQIGGACDAIRAFWNSWTTYLVAEGQGCP